MSGWAERALVPEPFREFLPYASPNAVRVIHFAQVGQAVGRAAVRSLSESAHRENVERIARDPFFSRSGIAVSVERRPDSGAALSSFSEAERIEIGNSILRVYFGCLRGEIDFPLDFRPSHFEWDSDGRRLKWYPSRLASPLDPEFRSALCSLYRGFFEDDPEASRRGLGLYAWKTPVDARYFEKVEEVLRAHFGDARSEPILFSMEHFKQSFKRLFDVAIAERAKLHPELSLIGVGLAGLYVSLEELGVPLDVRSAYRSVFGS